jgi:hypothetical protein
MPTRASTVQPVAGCKRAVLLGTLLPCVPLPLLLLLLLLLPLLLILFRT